MREVWFSNSRNHTQRSSSLLVQASMKFSIENIDHHIHFLRALEMLEASMISFQVRETQAQELTKWNQSWVLKVLVSQLKENTAWLIETHLLAPVRTILRQTFSKDPRSLSMDLITRPLACSELTRIFLLQVHIISVRNLWCLLLQSFQWAKDMKCLSMKMFQGQELMTRVMWISSTKVLMLWWQASLSISMTLIVLGLKRILCTVWLREMDFLWDLLKEIIFLRISKILDQVLMT